MNTPSPHKSSLSINLDLRIVCLILLAIIVGMLALWRPWEQTSAANRKVTLSGESSIVAVPDQFTFSPYYEKTGDTAKADLDALGNKLLEELKKLGVNEEDITLGGSNYDRYYSVAPVEGSSEETVSLQVQVVVSSKQLAQKVQDYLATTDAKGQLTGQPSFSKQKTKQLQTEARQKAIEDAQAKAKQTASELDVTVGKVITVKDQSNQIAFPYPAYGIAESADEGKSLPVTPGKQEVSYQIEVTFELY